MKWSAFELSVGSYAVQVKGEGKRCPSPLTGSLTLLSTLNVRQAHFVCLVNLSLFVRSVN
jgi:hypothetical protein